MQPADTLKCFERSVQLWEDTLHRVRERLDQESSDRVPTTWLLHPGSDDPKKRKQKARDQTNTLREREVVFSVLTVNREQRVCGERTSCQSDDGAGQYCSGGAESLKASPSCLILLPLSVASKPLHQRTSRRFKCASPKMSAFSPPPVCSSTCLLLLISVSL